MANPRNAKRLARRLGGFAIRVDGGPTPLDTIDPEEVRRLGEILTVPMDTLRPNGPVLFLGTDGGYELRIPVGSMTPAPWIDRSGMDYVLFGEAIHRVFRPTRRERVQRFILRTLCKITGKEVLHKRSR